jgi:hypothetical protein
MRVRERTKEIKEGMSEGHMPAKPAIITHLGNEST